MNEPTRSVHAPHRDRLAKALDSTSILANKAKTAGVLVSLLALVGLALTSCTVPGFSRNTSAGLPYPHCVALLARASASPTAPVVGAYNCLASRMQGGQVRSDADIQAVAAQAPVYTHFRYVGHTLAGYYFEYTGDPSSADATSGPVVGCFRYHVDASGRIDHIAYGPIPCPHPLP